MKPYHGVGQAPRPEVCTDHGTEYSFVIPHDMETLIDFMGGPDTFERRLDIMVGTRGVDCLRLVLMLCSSNPIWQLRILV
jgi:hypothetical protein